MSFTVRPSQWEIEHAGGIFAGQAYQVQHNGQLPDTPMWRLLEYRYSVNAARFTFYHPNIGRMIAQKLTPPPPPPVVPPVTPPPVTPPSPITPPPPVGPPITPPPTDGGGSDGGGQVIVPPPGPGDGGAITVPEPGAFSMLLVSMVVLGAFCLHMAKRATGRGISNLGAGRV